MSASVTVARKGEELGSLLPPSRRPPTSEVVPGADTRKAAANVVVESAATASGNAAEQFAVQQLRGLIDRVFFPGWPKASRQVVISAADAQADTTGVCARIACEMAVALPGTVCAVEADVHTPNLADSLGSRTRGFIGRESSGCIHLAENLWLAKLDNLFAGENGFSAASLRTCLSELRRNFDYTLIHAPAAFLTQTLVLGQLADGLVLVIEADKTRRAVARTTLGVLKAAKVAVLGAVLTGRSFPIPENLYKRL